MRSKTDLYTLPLGRPVHNSNFIIVVIQKINDLLSRPSHLHSIIYQIVIAGWQLMESWFGRVQMKREVMEPTNTESRNGATTRFELATKMKEPLVISFNGAQFGLGNVVLQVI